MVLKSVFSLSRTELGPPLLHLPLHIIGQILLVFLEMYSEDQKLVRTYNQAGGRIIGEQESSLRNNSVYRFPNHHTLWNVKYKADRKALTPPTCPSCITDSGSGELACHFVNPYSSTWVVPHNYATQPQQPSHEQQDCYAAATIICVRTSIPLNQHFLE